MPKCTSDAVRCLDSEPSGLQNYPSQLGYARPELRLGNLRIVASAGAAEPSALLNAVGRPPHFMPSGAPDAVRLDGSEPHRFEDSAPQLLNAGPERGFGRA